MKLPEHINAIIIKSSKRPYPEPSEPGAIVLRLSHEKPMTIGIDDIRRQLTETVYLKPLGCEKKIYLIEDAELMTPQAQNALLKTLEEPPEYAVIVLITSNEKLLLDTIRSRCITIRDEVEEEPEDDEIVSQNEEIFARLGNMDAVTALEYGQMIIARGPGGAARFLDAVRRFLLAQAGTSLRSSFNLSKAMASIDRAEGRLRSNVNTELTLEMLLMEI